MKVKRQPTKQTFSNNIPEKGLMLSIYEELQLNDNQKPKSPIHNLSKDI
jgi:hypothetical protein